MIITAIILLIYVLIALFRLRKDNNYILSKEFTTVIKGLCSIVVIFVHIPSMYSNRLQDAVGSFAYICVTLFFSFSAYGLRWSIEYKKGYLNSFIKNRILVLSIPFIIAYAVKYIFMFSVSSGGTYFVLQLLILYIAFYIIYKYLHKHKDIVMCITVLGISLLGRLTGVGIGWFSETIGFMYGILMFLMINAIKEFSKRNFVIKVIILVILSLIMGFIYLKIKYVWFIGDYIFKIVLGVAIISLLLLLSSRYKIYNPLSIRIGKVSYEIFLMHGLVIELLQKFSPRLSSGIFIMLVVIGTLIFAYLLSLLDNYIIAKITTKKKTDKT